MKLLDKKRIFYQKRGDNSVSFCFLYEKVDFLLEEYIHSILITAIIFVTPLIVYGLYFLCNENGCNLSRIYDWKSFFQEQLFDIITFSIYLLWWVFLILSWFFIPGYFKQGNVLNDGTRLVYKINGFRTLVFVLSGCMIGFCLKGVNFLEFLWNHYLSLITSSLIVSIILSFLVYIYSFLSCRHFLKIGNAKNHIYDFYMGRELNPRIGLFDIKEFVELRPGIILWVVLNLSFAAHQYILLEGKMTNSMMLVCLFQIWYCVDSLWNEELVLTTMDITTERFGFMLCFGCITWVPFTYSLQVRYLAFHPVYLNNFSVFGIVLLQCLGFWIFRSANSQKDTFRKNPSSPSVQHLTYITTKRGTKLITNGWWGKSRHINYFGDWLMAWSWCLPTGFKNPITYFYVIYFAVLLIHRERRDNYMCSVKYGKDWDEYCRQVPYRIIPYIY
ncbi:hypothetical protein PORY_000403 [Pneumocystis oryctolagi]|uniref:Uncharacterized protein n=1 Tax=Pneumocystis oryctolagi TaxID=42067 RepID=A0ACB7CGR3_9ASCO|nr:hypothetical protein PORY_000403 [Pneumocystis oryctolagi]